MEEAAEETTGMMSAAGLRWESNAVGWSAPRERVNVRK